MAKLVSLLLEWLKPTRASQPAPPSGEMEVKPVVDVVRKLCAWYTQNWEEKCRACGTKGRGYLYIQLGATNGVVIICKECEKTLMIHCLRNWVRANKGRLIEGGYTGAFLRADIMEGGKEDDNTSRV